MTTRVEFPVYACTQGLPSHTRYAFEAGEEGISTDGGIDGRWHQVGTVTAPAGSHLAEAKIAEALLYLPNDDAGIPADKIVQGGYYALGIGFRDLPFVVHHNPT